MVHKEDKISLHIYRSIKKVISLRNISKVFSHFYTLMAYVFFTFLECSSTLRVMAWRDIMYKDLSLLLEHNAFTLVCISQS